ncbi:MAG: hypothetical protein KGL39_50860 [Patescibacteria group bacterium]|nr:hypothetical protein [Patescibacteria group bacterium]
MTTPNTTPLTWNTYFTAVATMMVVQTTTSSGLVVGVDDATNQFMPLAISYAELRLQRDLQLLPARTSRTYTLTSGNNQLLLSSNDFVTVETVRVDPGTGSVPLLPASVEFIQNVYNSVSTQGTPAYFAMYGGDLATGGNTSNILLLGPPPAGSYTTTVTGMIRLPTLYTTNSTTAQTATTFLSTYYPDLLIQASMVYVAEYQRNFSAASNDPQMPGVYESQYQTLLASARQESAQSKFESSGWSSKSPPAIASPGR